MKNIDYPLSAQGLILLCLLFGLTACDNDKAIQRKLVGKWAAVSSKTTHPNGYSDSVGNLDPSAHTIEFFEDNTYAEYENFQPEIYIRRGKFEIVNGHTLKKKVVEVTRDNKTEKNSSYADTLEFNILADRLTTESYSSFSKLQYETTYVRASIR